MPFFIKQFIFKVFKRFGHYPIKSIVLIDYKEVVAQQYYKIDSSDSLYKKKKDFLDQLYLKADTWFHFSSGPFGFLNKKEIFKTVDILHADNQSSFELSQGMDRESNRYWKFKDYCKSVKIEVHRDFKQLIEIYYDR